MGGGGYRDPGKSLLVRLVSDQLISTLCCLCSGPYSANELEDEREKMRLGWVGIAHSVEGTQKGFVE